MHKVYRVDDRCTVWARGFVTAKCTNRRDALRICDLLNKDYTCHCGELDQLMDAKDVEIAEAKTNLKRLQDEKCDLAKGYE